MAQTLPKYNEEERQVLRQARVLRELLEHPGWKEFEAIVRAHMKARETIILRPSSEASPEFQSRDAASKYAELEYVKGALYGMGIMLNLPSATISAAKEIVRDHEDEPPGE